MLLNRDAELWWVSAASPLAVLLYQAGYSMQRQIEILSFFATWVVPELGPALWSTSLNRSEWKSFMTDDGTPIELSWDWSRSKGQPPVVRFSIEPISSSAGSQADPWNTSAGLSFIRRLRHMLPEFDSRWLDHFSKDLLVSPNQTSDLDSKSQQDQHKSQFFIAFDIHRVGIMAKAYFLPVLKSAATGLTNWELIVRSIAELQSASNLKLEAFKALEKFINKSLHRRFDVEILAIDCVSPMEARLKIYLRSPDTSFDSVQEMVTLGDQKRCLQIANRLKDLRELWDAVTYNGKPKDASQNLWDLTHRTAGILYNFEIRAGQQDPIPKVYIPVRHYGQNDLAVIEGLWGWLKDRELDSAIKNYTNALTQL
ncbi:hypothetical protein MMC20_007444 [Loxospora ochrophaea]|nr:hypothetical protein [Loxospora ochrophaea]